MKRWVGLTNGERFAVRGLYPESRNYGVYAKGDDLVVAVGPGQALVLELGPTKGLRAVSAPPAGVPADKVFLTLKEILPRVTERDLRLVR